MSQVVAPVRERPLILLGLAALALFALYLVGIDQGHLLAFVQSASALEQNLLHELVHDARHAAGFPCH